MRENQETGVRRAWQEFAQLKPVFVGKEEVPFLHWSYKPRDFRVTNSMSAREMPRS
jgi:hypothetical protein